MHLMESKSKVAPESDNSLLDLQKNKSLPPQERASLLKTLPADRALHAFVALPVGAGVSLFPYLGLMLQKKILREIARSRASYLLNALPSDERMAFFSALKAGELLVYLGLLSEKNQAAIQALLEYPPGSVARFINTDFAAIDRSMTVGGACAYLREHHKDSEAVNVIYVVDEKGRLLDDVPVRKLVLSEPETTIRQLLDGFCVRLKMTDSREEALQKFRKYDREVLPVTDGDYHLVGVVTVDDVLKVAAQESTGQLQQFGGITALEAPYAHTSFFDLLRKRAGWLVLLFGIELLTVLVMNRFGAALTNAGVRVLFLPLVLCCGGNSSTQAAALVIRVLALKELSLSDWWYFLRREAAAGLLSGVLLGGLGCLSLALGQRLHLWDYGGGQLGLTLFLSLTGIVLWGTLCGSLLPMLLKKAGASPTAASAPLVATLADVTGMILYFTLAAVLMKDALS
ncbi:magnesium transporter [Paraflavisolibacter sp. H34]|uniref:magnesium transporter n=1 Tax=Huijunlia imazamoxiresistens TaxID=3127457 RepID=UPI0030197963